MQIDREEIPMTPRKSKPPWESGAAQAVRLAVAGWSVKESDLSGV
jgi:hypothetical protein